MAREPRVISPIRTLYTRNGVDVALISIEVWASEVVVRLVGLPTEETRLAEDHVHAALEEWARRGAAGSPPTQPADDVFDIEISVGDDLGTGYTLNTRSRGGSGTMFRGDWFFEPGVPDGASRLTVDVRSGPDDLAWLDLHI